jgi:hypothetical protein
MGSLREIVVGIVVIRGNLAAQGAFPTPNQPNGVAPEGFALVFQSLEVMLAFLFHLLSGTNFDTTKAASTIHMVRIGSPLFPLAPFPTTKSLFTLSQMDH